MTTNNEILKFIDSTSYLYSNYTFSKLKEEVTLELIRFIIHRSGKELGESVLILLSVIKYLFGEKQVFQKLEESNGFIPFISQNREKILEISARKNVQGNLPARALPVLDVLARKFPGINLGVLELGASFGLIGRCLLNPHGISQKGDKYFSKRRECVVRHFGFGCCPSPKIRVGGKTYGQRV